MPKGFHLVLVVFFLITSSVVTKPLFAQLGEEKLMTFGLQLKPIFPSDYFNASGEFFEQNGVEYTLSQRPGYAFGMVIRKNFTRLFSVETGINYVRRNYSFSVNDLDTAIAINDQFRIIGYEIPTLGLVYIRLGKRLYMNAAFGASFDLFPSDVSNSGEFYLHLSRRNSWLQMALLANLGFEYRTKNSGIFYIGSSLHRPFTDSYRTLFRYTSDTKIDERFTSLNGNYLTLDLRYFFHEDPEKKGLRKKSKKKKFKDYLPFGRNI